VTAAADAGYREQYRVRRDGEWADVLESVPYATVPREDSRPSFYRAPPRVTIRDLADGFETVIDDERHSVRRTVTLDKENEDLVHVSVTFSAGAELRLSAVEDKFLFMRAVRSDEGIESGPLDFVWSQHIKRFETSFIPHYCFKCPTVMMQQGEFFAAIVAGLEQADASYVEKTPLGFDLNVRDEAHPWMSVGAIASLPVLPNMPCEPGHSVFVRGAYDAYRTINLKKGESIYYRYTLCVSLAPRREGYRSIQRYLWKRYGCAGLLQSRDIQKCDRYPGVELFEDWRREIWDGEAAGRYFSYARGGVAVGSIAAGRQGDKDSRTGTKQDAWFSCWLQELWIGWGLFLYGRSHNLPEWKNRAETILDFILTAPRSKGAFPIVCYHEKDGSDTWLRDDGWAGYKEEFHAVQMSWTAWLLLMWGRRLFPDRMPDILGFCTGYAGFLAGRQREDGCIPAWFDADGNPSREAFRDFNAETSISALFLLELGEITSDPVWLEKGARALDFITDKVLPRQRWYDYETFISCARKPFDFYDGYTAQYPQNNLSTIFAALAYLKRFEIRRSAGDLELGTKVLDYLLLTQQVWDHPLLTVNVFGGFTTQNTDSEWSDARGGICGVVLYWYYLETGKREYLERAISAVRAGFPVAPYENWAHWGFEGLQYDSSLLWGAGTTLAAVEIIAEDLGDLYVDLAGSWGLGINACLLKAVHVERGSVRILVDPADAWTGREMLIRFSGAVGTHSVTVNDHLLGVYDAARLASGLRWKVEKQR